MSTSFNDKNGVKVSRPPGGQTSNIFGPPIEQDTRRRVSNTTKSSIFDEPTPLVASPSRSKRHQENTQDKLFGEPEPLPPPKSADPEVEKDQGKEGEVETNGKAQEGVQANGKNHEEAMTNGKTNGAPKARVRQPPGGKSSGLW